MDRIAAIGTFAAISTAGALLATAVPASAKEIPYLSCSSKSGKASVVKAKKPKVSYCGIIVEGGPPYPTLALSKIRWSKNGHSGRADLLSIYVGGVIHTNDPDLKFVFVRPRASTSGKQVYTKLKMKTNLNIGTKAWRLAPAA